jgi:hypothetical protein
MWQPERLECWPRAPHNGFMADNVKRGEDYVCDGCGSLYKVMWTTTPFPDTDTADCEVCGRRIQSWNGQTTWPDYQLLKRGPGK